MLFAIGCGTSGGGEPLMGDVTIQYGSASPQLTTGSAIESANAPGMMVVQLGTDHVDCHTDLSGSTFPEAGTYVVFTADATTPGSNPQAEVGIEHVASNNIDLISGPGTVTIGTIGDRVTGSVSYTTTDSTIGAIAVSGNFDVKRCF